MPTFSSPPTGFDPACGPGISAMPARHRSAMRHGAGRCGCGCTAFNCPRRHRPLARCGSPPCALSRCGRSEPQCRHYRARRCHRSPSSVGPVRLCGAYSDRPVQAWTAGRLAVVDIAKPWVRGRAVLVGDAAHAMAPSAAQGGAQAIEDAWVLADRWRGTRKIRSRRSRPMNAFAARAWKRSRARRGEISQSMIFPACQRPHATCAAYCADARLLSRLDWLFGWKPE